VAIRELAVLLRNALAAKTQDAHKEVYCWQVRRDDTFCCCCRCWCCSIHSNKLLLYGKSPATLSSTTGVT
jgi:hypothetical protein